MNGSFTATKLFTPQSPPGFILRPRLTLKCSEGLRRKLILVSAPPGFGKTSLVVAWIGSFNNAAEIAAGAVPRFTWYSLDETDDDLAQFFTCLSAALQKAEPSLA